MLDVKPYMTREQYQDIEELMHYSTGMDLWDGKLEMRKMKFVYLHQSMNKIFGFHVKILFNWNVKSLKSDMSMYLHPEIVPSDGLIIMQGRLSLITFMHEWGHALGMEQGDAQMFATELFEKHYPEQWAKIVKTPSGTIRDPIVVRSD